MVEALRAKGVQLWTDGEHLRYRAPPGTMEVADVDRIRTHKRQLIDFLGVAPVEPRPSVIPLSFGQERLWVTEQLTGASPSYNSCGGFRLRGSLDVEALSRALQRIVDRHEALRTVIRATDGKPEQIILPQLAQELRTRELAPDNAEEQLRQIGLEEARAPFSLENGPLLRTTLVRLDAQLHVLFVTTHHIVSDGWSMGRFAGELLTLYAAFSKGQPDPLPPLPMQYADYACWQRASLQGEGTDRQLAYWRRELEGAPATVDLPVDGVLRSDAGAQLSMSLPPELTASIVGLSAREGSTAFMTLLAAYQLLLYRFCGQDDFCVGVPIANRNRLGAEPLIGFFLNTLIIRAQVTHGLTFRQLLAQVRQRALGAFEHQDLPIDMLLGELDAGRTAGYGAYRQACFTLQSQPLAAREISRLTAMAELEVEPAPVDSGTCKSDLLLALNHGVDSLRGYWEYSTERFDAATIDCFAENYRRLLEQIVIDPDMALDDFVLSVDLERYANRPEAAGSRRTLTRAQTWLWAKLNADERTFESHVVCVEIDAAFDADRLRAAVARVTASSQALTDKLAIKPGLDRADVCRREPEWTVLDYSSSDDPEAAADRWIELQRRQRLDADDSRIVSYSLLKISPQRTLWVLQAHSLWIDEHSLFSIARATAGVCSDQGLRPIASGAQLFRRQIGAELAYRCSTTCARERWAWAQSTHRAVSLACFERTGTHDGPSRRSTQTIFRLAQSQQYETKALLVAATALYVWRVAVLRDPALQEVSVGLACSGRTIEGAADLIGCFGGVAALHTRMDPQQTVSDYVRQMSSRLGEVDRLGFFREEDARRALHLAAEQPLFGVLVSYEIADDLDFSGVGVRFRALGSGRVNDLWIRWGYDRQRELVELLIEANPSRYEQWELDAHGRNLAKFVETLAQTLHCPIGELQLGSTHSQANLLNLGKGESRPEDATTSLVARILTTARERADALAVVSREGTLSYAELDAWSGKIARHLFKLNLASNCLIAVHGLASREVLAALLGIWRAGHAYISIDPALPAERIKMLLEDSEVAAVLSSEPHAVRGAGVPVHDLSSIIADDGAGSETHDAVPCDLEALAYCIYTSGSTGKPKAVQIRHAGVANHCLFARREFALSSADRVLQFASLSFDASVEEIFPTWLAGATLVLREHPIASVQDFSDLLIRERITVLDLPTAYWQQWIAAVDPHLLTSSKVRLVVVGGERVSVEAFRHWHQLTASADIEWLNTYGPTETTVISTMYRSHEHSAELASIPIGRPISNTHIYVLDERRQPVPVGVAGEIYIGGAGVARGYLNREELTRERFLSDPFREEADARMYRTGDLGRWRADGELEYLGRNDQQVKIRGFRIELGEIEARLMEHADIAEAVVVAREEAQGERRLVAYYTSRGPEVNAEQLRTHLKSTLPEYMVPAAYVELDSLPLTPNGKLDRKNLPAPDAGAVVSTQYEPPQGETEHALAAMWCELLHVERVGREDNFFELGGHSLLAVQLIVRIRRTFDVDVAVLSIFELPTLAQQADLVISAQLEQFDQQDVERAAASIETADC